MGRSGCSGFGPRKEALGGAVEQGEERGRDLGGAVAWPPRECGSSEASG